MRVEYINPFISSLCTTFRTVLDCEVERGALSLMSDNVAGHPISGVVGLSGNAVGTVVLNLSADVALNAASVMLDTQLSAVDADVIDAVGELTNIVAGAAKAQLEQYRLMVSLPNVVTGENHQVRFPSNVRPIRVPFTCPWGELALEVGFTPVAQPAVASV